MRMMSMTLALALFVARLVAQQRVVVAHVGCELFFEKDWEQRSMQDKTDYRVLTSSARSRNSKVVRILVFLIF